MNSVTFIKTALISGTPSGFMSALAVIDPSIQNIAVAVIGATVTITTVVFAYKTAQLNRKLKEQDETIAEVKKTSDGMKDALVKAAASESLAKGVLAGIEQAEAKAAVKSAARAEGRAQGGQGGTLASPSLLPSQVQPVAAGAVEGVELTEEQINKMIHELSEQARKIRLKPGIAQAEASTPTPPPL